MNFLLICCLLAFLVPPSLSSDLIISEPRDSSVNCGKCVKLCDGFDPRKCDDCDLCPLCVVYPAAKNCREHCRGAGPKEKVANCKRRCRQGVGLCRRCNDQC